jgi:hypothetical protein
MSVVLPYLPAGADPAAMRMAAVCEALTESGGDFLSAPRDSIPPGPTYRLRRGDYRYGDVRVLPSYLPTGRSYLIERSKREMIAEDLRLALGLMST